jgi:hypothetical protein
VAGATEHGASMAIIVRQMRRIVEEMKSEWEIDPVSDELKDGFLLILDYIDHVEKCRIRMRISDDKGGMVYGQDEGK